MWAAPSKSMSSSQQKGFHIPNRWNSSVYSENREVKFHLWFFFFFTKCEPKICLLLLILPKTTSQVWGKGKFRNNGKVPLYSLYWWHKAAAMLSPRQWHSHAPRVQGVSPPPSCAERLSGCTCGRHSREFKLGQRSKTSIYLSGILGIFLAPL